MVTRLDALLEQLELDPLERGLQIISAAELAGDSFPRLDTDRPALVLNLSKDNLAAVARTLRANYPAAHPLILARGARRTPLALAELEAAKLTRSSVLLLLPLAHASSPLTLANIMARLRAPNGCPWDREQTHASITRALVEETYEVIEAISDNDMAQLREELGDLLLHVLFQTQIARDENAFALSDVGAELAAKLIRRHPHVFGDEQAADSAWVLQNWEKIKQQEKTLKGQSALSNRLDAGIPRDLPALTRAQKVTERARRQHAARVKPGNAVKRIRGRRKQDRERALGEALLELAAVAQEQGIDAERALNAATRRLVQRHQQ